MGVESKDKIPLLDLARLHAPLEGELLEAFLETLRSGNFIQGPIVEEFEAKLAKSVGVQNVIGVSSGTDALLVSMMALEVEPGDEIITTPYTFFATAGCIARLGARPVFVDIDDNTFNIDPSLVPAAVTEKTVGIIPVHLFGQCVDMDPILETASINGLWVLEDAAQAIGAEYDGKYSGSLGDMGIFSFFPAKNLGALGDGGAVTTNDKRLAEKVRSHRQHGSQNKYKHEDVGGNFRLDSLQAAFLSVKLPHLRSWEDGRRRVATIYNEELKDLENLQLPHEVQKLHHVYNQYVVRSNKRDALARALDSAGIGSAVYYPLPLHLQECFKELGYSAGDFPMSERASKEALALPVDPLLEDQQLQKIIQTIRNLSK